MADVIDAAAVPDVVSGDPPVTPNSAPQTIAEGATPADTPPPPPDWPTDWREKAAKAVGDDPKFLDKLKTMGSPADLAKSYRELEKWKDSSKRIPELPDKPNDAQLAEYRKAVGVPDTPDKYNFDLGNGFIWADGDKAMLEDFGKFAHDTHMPERYARTAVSWQALHNRKVAEEYATKDKAFLNESMHDLMKEWGPDYEANANAAGLFLGRIPETVRRDVLFGRTTDGKVFANHPDILRWALQMEKTLNPAATLLPAGGGDPGKTLENEWDGAMETRRTDPDKYWSDPFQKKVKKLAEAKAAMESRGRKSA